MYFAFILCCIKCTRAKKIYFSDDYRDLKEIMGFVRTNCDFKSSNSNNVKKKLYMIDYFQI